MSEKSLLISDAAKLLRVGPRALFEILHGEGIIAPKTNLPRHDLVLAGYFKVETRSYRIGKSDQSYGSQRPYSVTIVTDLGLTFLQDLLNKQPAATEAKEKTA